MKVFNDSATLTVPESGLVITPVPTLLTWHSFKMKMPWGIVFLLGGGFSVAKAAQVCNPTHACLRMRLYMCMWQCTLVCVHVHVGTYISVCVCARAPAWVYTCANRSDIFYYLLVSAWLFNFTNTESFVNTFKFKVDSKHAFKLQKCLFISRADDVCVIFVYLVWHGQNQIQTSGTGRQKSVLYYQAMSLTLQLWLCMNMKKGLASTLL